MDIHQLLTKGLSVDKGIRRRRVGITGTNYRPLDNEFQIREAMRDTCELINGKDNVFEKALLTLVLLSYIQAFSDGNKRTARITFMPSKKYLWINLSLPLANTSRIWMTILMLYQQTYTNTF